MLTLPRVRCTLGAALIGRSAYALVFLPLLYAVTDATGSVAMAGAAVALYGAGATFLAPLRAWCIDQYGARRTLSTLTFVFGGTLAAIGIVALLDASGATLIALSAAAGAFAPPYGPTMRVAWGKLVPTGPLLKKALSLDAVIEELLYLAGPAAAGVALAFVAPGFALLVPSALVLIGGSLFIMTHTIGQMAPRDVSTGPPPRRRILLLEPTFVPILLPALVAGGVFGSLSVTVPVALSDEGGPAAAGIALGLFAGGSAVGGLLYGALSIPGSTARHLIVLATALVAASSLVAIVSGAVATTVVVALAGLFFSPVMIVAYLAAHTAGGPDRQTAATTWVNTSHNLGTTVGAAVAGVVIQAVDVPTAAVATSLVAALLLTSSATLQARASSTPKRSRTDP